MPGMMVDEETAESSWARQREWARQQTPTDDSEWARQQTPVADIMPYQQSFMNQQPQLMQMMVMPMHVAYWGHQAQLPLHGNDCRKDGIAMKAPPGKNSMTDYHVQLRHGVESAMLPGELTVMRKALADMQRVRPSQSSSMDSLPSYQGTTMDTLPAMDSEELSSGPRTAGGAQTKAASLMKALTGCDERTRAEAVEQVADSMWPMAVQRHGCRVAQKAFEVADGDQKNLLAEGLRGHIREAIESPHGNYVVQRCVESNSVEGTQIVVDEMRGASLFFSRRRFGCRVIERLLENCTRPQVSEIGQEVMREADELITHPFGNFVMQHILKYGAAEDQHRIVKFLVRDIYNLAKHRVASHVIEAALAHSCPEDRRLLLQALSADPSELALLSQSHYGCFVAREMTRMKWDMAPGANAPRMF